MDHGPTSWSGRAIGLTGDMSGPCVRSASAATWRISSSFVRLGSIPAFAVRVKASGIKVVDADDLVELRALGVTKPPAPPKTPRPLGGWNPHPDPGG